MRKKIVIIVLCIIVLIFFTWLIVINSSKRTCLKTGKEEITSVLTLISDFVNKYEIKKSGKVLVNANYKGAHGENYPAEFNYNYEYSDKLYFESDKYSYLNIDENLVKVKNILSKLKDVDVDRFSDLKSINGSYSITYDEKYINEVLGTNFKSVKVFIKLKGLRKKIEQVEIILDDILVTKIGDNINVKYKNNDIDIKLGESAYYVNINDKLKMNIFVKDSYVFSIVLNNQVYSVEIKDDEVYAKFNTSAAIYNNITLKINYEDVSLEKVDEEENLIDNPLIRYLSESDLSVWR